MFFLFSFLQAAAQNGSKEEFEKLLIGLASGFALQDKVLFIFSLFLIVMTGAHFCSFCFCFSLSHHFSIFFLKDGRTPLFVAAENGYEQIVRVLLEKGNPNVDLADQVLLLF